ncbi:MAG TPA: ABC transporter permease [Blastocatellia bacterium]|nr:ABC transporter permease [Blastocatellia bacterium]
MKIKSLIPIETIAMALNTIRAHKFRSALTVLGIVVGVVTVVAVASILTGLRSRIVSMVEEYGTNNIYAFHLSTGPRLGDRDRSEYMRKPLTAEDGDAILQRAPAIDAVANVLFMWRMDSTLKYNGQKYRSGFLQGVSASYAQVTNVSLQQGRFITEVDDQHKRDVIVIGPNVAESLFPQQPNIIGNYVDLAGHPFEIIGVLEKRQNSFFGENEEDNALFVPYETGRKLSPISKELNLHIRAKSGMLQAGIDQVEEVLRRQRGIKYDQPNNFQLQTASKIIEQFDGITMYVGLFAIAISAVGLLVGGIGVMNIMLVSVTERTREIGIRKAIGAKKHDIVRQFLFEAMTLTFLGGVLGVLVATVISYVIMFFLPELPASIPTWAVASGLIVSTGIGLIFGVWPAKKAANLDPIECLRYE